MSTSQFSHMLPGIIRSGKPFNRATTFFTDFTEGGDFSTTADAAKMILDGSTTAVLSDYTATTEESGNGWAKLTESTTDTVQIQGNGEPFAPGPGRRIVFESRLRMDGSALGGGSSDADDPEWFVGLASYDPSVIAGVGDGNWVGFHSDTDSFSISYTHAKDGSSTITDSTAASTTVTGETNADTTIDYVSGTIITLRFEIWGTDEILYFTDGKLRNRVAILKDTDGTVRDLPNDDAMSPVIAYTGSADLALVDYILCVGDRV